MLSFQQLKDGQLLGVSTGKLKEQDRKTSFSKTFPGKLFNLEFLSQPIHDNNIK
jgi:hypothetical protein